MNKWVVFDAMGVLFEVGDDHNELLVPYVRARNHLADPAQIVEEYMRASLGSISSKEFWNRIGLGASYPIVEMEYLDTCPTVCQGAIDLANKLKGSFSLAILSNDIKEWAAYLRQKHELDRMFDVAVISGEMGVRKPSKAIFDALLKKTGARAADVLLLDDSQRNIDAALKLGWKAFCVSTDKKIRRETDGKCLAYLSNVEILISDALLHG